ncbi:MAG: tetratricopeptide repeat protein [Helicobacteraceae bacterium]|jgi:tetratricopeptide (TPR) repeat protein|nr:tetratricopeptide repeat protein [Helicobacteraceae bacterium]
MATEIVDLLALVLHGDRSLSIVSAAQPQKKRKSLKKIIGATTLIVLVLTAAGYFTYKYLAYKRLVDSAFDRGVAAQERGDYQEAVKQYTQEISLDPQFATAYGNRGNAYYYLGDYKNATSDARKACDLGDCISFKFLKYKNALSD